MRSSLLCSLLLGGSVFAGDILVRDDVQVDLTATGVGLNPSIASDGDLVAISYFDGGSAGTTGVFVVTSDGRGIDWSSPVRVDTDTTGASKIANFDACAVKGQNVYVTWKDDRLGSSTDDVVFNRSTDGGATFPAGNERILDDGYNGAGQVRAWRFAAGDADNLFVIMASDGPNSNEEVFLANSTDGGDTWTTRKVAGDGPNYDVDSVAIAAEGARCYMTWDSDESDPGSNNDSIYYRLYDADFDVFEIVQQLDVTDLGDTGDVQFGSNYSFDIAVSGDLVAAVWLEERTSTSNEEVRVAYSVDGGFNFQPDEAVGNYVAGADDVDFADVAIVDGNIVVAYTDNRVSLGSLDDVYVSVLEDAVSQTNSFVEVGPLSGAEGGSGVRVTGGRTDVAVTYTSDLSGGQYAGAATSIDGGLSWQTDLRLSDDSGTFDADVAEVGYNPLYQNFVHAWLSNETGNTNNVFVGGYRAQTLTPVGWVAGPTVASFEFERFAPQAQNAQGVVLLSLGLMDGSFTVPPMRDSGMTFDSLSQVGFDFVSLFLTPLDANGNGATLALPLSLAPGVTIYATGLGFTTGFGSAARLSDIVEINL